MSDPERIPLEGEILRGADEKMGANERRVRSGFWKKLAIASEKIPFLEEVVAAYYCALDPQTPGRVRAILLAGLAYFILPLDTIPDFLLGFGFTDDIAVLSGILATLRGNISDAHRSLARERLTEFRANHHSTDDGGKAT